MENYEEFEKLTITNKEFRKIHIYECYDYCGPDPCVCDYVHRKPKKGFSMWNGIRRPDMIHDRSQVDNKRYHYHKFGGKCKVADAKHDSWKLHRKTQYYRINK